MTQTNQKSRKVERQSGFAVSPVAAGCAVLLISVAGAAHGTTKTPAFSSHWPITLFPLPWQPRRGAKIPSLTHLITPSLPPPTPRSSTPFAAPCHGAAKTSSPIFFNPWLAFTRYQLVAVATYLRLRLRCQLIARATYLRFATVQQEKRRAA